MTNKQILESIKTIDEFLDKFLDDMDCSNDVIEVMITLRNNILYDVVDNCGRRIFDSCRNRYEKCWTCENHENYKERDGLYKE